MPVCSYDSHGLGKRTDRVAGWTELGLHWEAFLGSAVWGAECLLGRALSAVDLPFPIFVSSTSCWGHTYKGTGVS